MTIPQTLSPFLTLAVCAAVPGISVALLGAGGCLIAKP